MDGVKYPLRQARYLGKATKRRVETDVETVKEKSKTILERWQVMKLMDYFWTTRANPEQEKSCRICKPYLVGLAWIFVLFSLMPFYYTDLYSSTALVWFVRIFQLLCLALSLIFILCCFEQGQNLILGGLFLISVFWSAPPRKHTQQNGR